MPGKSDPYGYCYIHTDINSYSYSDVYANVYSDVYPYVYGHSNVHAYANSDCYSGNPDSDAKLHTGRDLVRHFERFWYTGG